MAQWQSCIQPDSFGLLDICFILFVIAGVTDILDGYLARRFHAVTAFGRVVDPFVDKIMVCGALVFFVGVDFTRPIDRAVISGVYPWMVVVILTREFLITGIRGFSELSGVPFAASFSGKLKMLVQTVAVCWILQKVAHFPDKDTGWTCWGRDLLVWAMLVLTVISGLAYLNRAKDLLLSVGREETTG